jgi:hypothetical protein
LIAPTNAAASAATRGGERCTDMRYASVPPGLRHRRAGSCLHTQGLHPWMAPDGHSWIAPDGHPWIALHGHSWIGPDGHPWDPWDGAILISCPCTSFAAVRARLRSMSSLRAMSCPRARRVAHATRSGCFPRSRPNPGSAYEARRQGARTPLGVSARSSDGSSARRGAPAGATADTAQRRTRVITDRCRAVRL